MIMSTAEIFDTLMVGASVTLLSVLMAAVVLGLLFQPVVTLGYVAMTLVLVLVSGVVGYIFKRVFSR